VLTDNWAHGAASRQTIAPISHTRPSPRSRSYYSFPVPLRVGGLVGLRTQQVSNLLKVACSGPGVSRGKIRIYKKSLCLRRAHRQTEMRSQQQNIYYLTLAKNKYLGISNKNFFCSLSHLTLIKPSKNSAPYQTALRKHVQSKNAVSQTATYRWSYK